MRDKIYVVVIEQGLYADHVSAVYTYCTNEVTARECVNDLRNTIRFFKPGYDADKYNIAFFNAEHDIPWPFAYTLTTAEDIGVSCVSVSSWSGDKAYL